MGNPARSIVALVALFGVLAPAVAGDVGDLFRRVSPAVVVIETTQRDVAEVPGVGGQLVSVRGVGSGVLISDDGKVLTAAHVVQTADAVNVRFLSGEAIRARVLASEPAADVSLLQLDRLPKRAVVAPVGDSDKVRIGDRVLVVGAPHGIGHTLTVGHISARRTSDAMLDAELFQTDAAINSGNSGGPMFNEAGEVIGIVSYIISQSGGSEGLGFAVTSNAARRTVIDHGSMWGGMEVKTLNGDLAKAFNVPQESAVLVQRVASGSPGAHLGIRAGSRRIKIGNEEMIVGGDIVLSLMGVSLAEPGADAKIREKIAGLKDRDKMTVQVLRGGEVVDLNNYFFQDLLVPSAPGGSKKKRR